MKLVTYFRMRIREGCVYFDFQKNGYDLGQFKRIKPVLAPPIIFIPLLSSYQGALVNVTDVTIADLLILLVSFQNGFFWKVVFDKQAETLRKKKR
jgi:hypothetical protein